MQQEFAAALYQLMTQTCRKEENDPHSSESQIVQDNENNTKSNVLIFNNKNESIIPNGISKQIIDSKSNMKKATNTIKNMNGISVHGKQYSVFSICKNVNKVVIY